MICVVLAAPSPMWVAEGDAGLKEQQIPVVGAGDPIYYRDFMSGRSASPVRVVNESGADVGGKKLPKSYWAVRQPGWTLRLLNAVGTPADLTLDPGISDTCDIFLGLRAVTPTMALGIRLASEKEFAVITAPAATPTEHFDYEFHWKWRVPMDGEKVVVRALGKPLYLQYLRFVPQVRRTMSVRVPKQRVPILKGRARHFAFPGVAELANGDLLVAAREGDAHVCPRGRIVLSRSTDGGRSWGPATLLYDSPSDERDPALLCLPGGTVVASCCTWDSWRASPSLCARYARETQHMERVAWGKYSGNWLLVSTDHGHTWSEPRSAPLFSPHGPVLGPDGALYWVGLEGRDGTSVVAIYRTADLGRTWARYAEVSYSRSYSQPMTWEFWDEPNLLFLPGGKAVCTIRVDLDGFTRQSYSADEGRTWSWPAKLPVWGYPQHLCRLMDGRLLLSYGYRKEPFGIRACLSSDGGRTWDLAREIVFRHDGADADLGYPYSIQLRDGRVLTVYYHTLQAGECFIEGVFYRP